MSSTWNNSQGTMAMNRISMEDVLGSKRTNGPNSFEMIQTSGKIPYTIKIPTFSSFSQRQNKFGNNMYNGAVGDIGSFLSLPQMTKSSEQAMNKANEDTCVNIGNSNKSKDSETIQEVKSGTSCVRPIIGSNNFHRNIILPNENMFPNLMCNEGSSNPISPTPSNSSSEGGYLSKSDSGIESLPRSSHSEFHPYRGGSKNVAELLKYLGNLPKEQVLAEISIMLETQQIDPTLLAKVVNVDHDLQKSSDFSNKDQSPLNSSMNTNERNTNIADFPMGLQQKNTYLPYVPLSNDKSAFEFSNLPPPEYLKNMPPPGSFHVATSNQSHISAHSNALFKNAAMYNAPSSSKNYLHTNFNSSQNSGQNQTPLISPYQAAYIGDQPYQYVKNLKPGKRYEWYLEICAKTFIYRV